MKIANANKRTISQIMGGNLPNMSETIKGWFQPLTFRYVTRTLDDNGIWHNGEEQTIKTLGVVQPPRDIDLKILPEGTWNWEWQLLHCLPDVNLEVDQFVVYENIEYKVMQVKPWQKYGYRRYLLLEAFKAAQIGNLN